jgi:hypothetical protein
VPPYDQDSGVASFALHRNPFVIFSKCRLYIAQGCDLGILERGRT